MRRIGAARSGALEEGADASDVGVVATERFARIVGIGARVANAISREEHVKDLNQIADRVSSLRDGLTEFQKIYGSNFTLGDQLKAMQSQINDLQSFLRTHNNGASK